MNEANGKGPGWPMLAKVTAALLSSVLLTIAGIVAAQVRENMVALGAHSAELREFRRELDTRVQIANREHAEFVRATELGPLRGDIQRLSSVIEKLDERLRLQEMRR